MQINFELQVTLRRQRLQTVAKSLGNYRFAQVGTGKRNCLRFCLCFCGMLKRKAVYLLRLFKIPNRYVGTDSTGKCTVLRRFHGDICFSENKTVNSRTDLNLRGTDYCVFPLLQLYKEKKRRDCRLHRLLKRYFFLPDRDKRKAFRRMLFRA